MGAKFKAGLKSAMASSALTNLCLTQNKLDNNLFLNHRERCVTLMDFSAYVVYLLSALVSPFMPRPSADICKMLNAPLRNILDTLGAVLLPGHCLGTPFYLFKRPEPDFIESLRQRYSGKK